MFTANKASKIATKYNGRVTEYKTKTNMVVTGVIFDPTSFKEFADSKQKIKYNHEKLNSVDVIF